MTKTQRTYTMTTHPVGFGIRRRYRFDNGYEASVIMTRYSYGGDKDLWELAVMLNNNVYYKTPVTNDVIGHLSDDDLEVKLDEIAALPRWRLGDG